MVKHLTPEQLERERKEAAEFDFLYADPKPSGFTRLLLKIDRCGSVLFFSVALVFGAGVAFTDYTPFGILGLLYGALFLLTEVL
jgi:hypothetical protein